MSEIKHEYVADIQNTIWKAYKETQETKSARGFNGTVKALESKYSKISMTMYNFISWLTLSWSPIINAIVEDGYSEEEKD